MTHPVHLTMPSTVITSMLEEVLMRWEEEEEELMLITSDGHKLGASPSLLMLHSPLLSSILLDSSKKELASISVPGSAGQVSALLNFISRGEATFKNPSMLTEVKWLAADIGIDLFNIKTKLCLGSETSSLAETEDVDEEEKLNNGFGNETGNVNEEEGNGNDRKENILVELRSKLQKIKNVNQIAHRAVLSENDFDENLRCSLCPQTFKSKSKLKIHSLYHSNMKCKYCKKGFVFGTLLKRHMESVHSKSGPEIINHAGYSIESVDSNEYLGAVFV